MDDIKYQDFERIIKYAMIYGLANERSDVLQQCGVFHRKNEKRTPDDRVSDGELRETQTANYFSNLYPIDCAVTAVNA